MTSALSRAPGRPPCAYGLGCYRRNPAHWQEYDHPAEHSFLRPASATAGEAVGQRSIDEQPAQKRTRGEGAEERGRGEGAEERGRGQGAEERARGQGAASSSVAGADVIDLGETTDEDEGGHAAQEAPGAASSSGAAADVVDLGETTDEDEVGDDAQAAAAPPIPQEAPADVVAIPACYRNPIEVPRAPKPNAPPQPVRLRLPDPWVGDAHLILRVFGACARPASGALKIAGFDFDDTLSERRAAGGKDKWKSTFWNHKFGASQPAMLRALASRGFSLVVCTNESVDHLKNPAPLLDQLTPKLARLSAWAADVGVPLVVLVAISKKAGVSSAGHTLHKQPTTSAGNAGMWHVAEALLGAPPGGGSGGESFFVGDAAGRPTDHGDDDKRLAASAGVRFYTEIDFFRNDPLRLLG